MLKNMYYILRRTYFSNIRIVNATRADEGTVGILPVETFIKHPMKKILCNILSQETLYCTLYEIF